MYKKKNDIRVDLKLLHPWLQYKINLLIKYCNKEGIYLAITEGYRTKDYQDGLYAKGRTKPGAIVTNAKGSDMQSQHQWGIAFDIGISATTTAEFYNETKIRQVAKIAKSKKVGLAWGGDWISPVDTPHFYLKKWGDTPKPLKEKYGTFERFKKTWTKKVGGTKKGLNLWNKTHTKVLRKKLPNGTKVEVLWSKLGWSKVKVGNQIGYMKKKYLK